MVLPLLSVLRMPRWAASHRPPARAGGASPSPGEFVVVVRIGGCVLVPKRAAGTSHGFARIEVRRVRDVEVQSISHHEMST
jgi:hypothetical protein